jgi:hypothetical protein
MLLIKCKIVLLKRLSKEGQEVSASDHLCNNTHRKNHIHSCEVYHTLTCEEVNSFLVGIRI